MEMAKMAAIQNRNRPNAFEIPASAVLQQIYFSLDETSRGQSVVNLFA